MNCHRSQELDTRKQNEEAEAREEKSKPSLGKDRIDLHLAIPKEDELAHLTQKEREVVFEFLMQHREEYVKIFGEIDKENRDLCTAANQVYNVAFQAEIAQFIGNTWAVQLGNMTTHDGLKQIIKLLRDNFLIDDDADQLIDDYVPEKPWGRRRRREEEKEEEEEEEGEIKKSPEQAPLPPGFKIQEIFDDDEVVVTGEIQTGKGKQTVGELIPTGDEIWKEAEAALDAQLAEIERREEEAQLDADFQAVVAEQMAIEAAGRTGNFGFDDFPVHTWVVGSSMAPAEQKKNSTGRTTCRTSRIVKGARARKTRTDSRGCPRTNVGTGSGSTPTGSGGRGGRRAPRINRFSINKSC